MQSKTLDLVNENVHYMHTCSQNILLDVELHAKLGDFGFSLELPTVAEKVHPLRAQRARAGTAAGTGGYRSGYGRVPLRAWAGTAAGTAAG